jgi:dCMP deaminase
MLNIDEFNIETSTDPKYADFLRECYEYAKNNHHHPSTHNAALLIKDDKILLKGMNILPQGVEEKKERFEGKDKHIYPNHAERDLIYKAARKGISTEGLTMVMPWLPCIPCANAIISSGIKTLIVHKQMFERTRDGWQEELKNAIQIMKEAKVKMIIYDGLVGSKAYMHSQEWDA